MLFTKTNPAGVDWYIQQLNTNLYNYLTELWGLTGSTYNAYSRIYRVPEEDNGKTAYMPKYYQGGNEFVPLVMNDTVILQSFFDIRDVVRVVDDQWNVGKIDLIMMANLGRLETLVTGTPPVSRYDEELICAVQTFLEENGEKFLVKEIYRGAKRALAEYSGSKKMDQLRRDLQPFYTCGFALELTTYDFNINQCG